MPPRDYTNAPISDQLGLPTIIHGLASDLDELRKGEISVNDAIARSMLAKQIFNGVRLYMNGTKLLSEQAKPVHTIADAKP
jgi:TRAP-type C4-dicarboxylate transport system substrate-binding protein